MLQMAENEFLALSVKEESLDIEQRAAILVFHQRIAIGVNKGVQEIIDVPREIRCIGLVKFTSCEDIAETRYHRGFFTGDARNYIQWNGVVYVEPNAIVQAAFGNEPCHNVHESIDSTLRVDHAYAASVCVDVANGLIGEERCFPLASFSDDMAVHVANVRGNLWY